MSDTRALQGEERLAHPLYVALDIASAAAMFAIGSFFALVWRRVGDPLHVLFATAFAMLGVGFTVVTTSEFDLTQQSEMVDGARIVLHTVAPLLLATGYWGARDGERLGARVAIGASLAGAVALALVVYMLPPFGAFDVGTHRGAAIFAHSVQFVLYLALVGLSARSFLRSPTWRRAWVPLAFLSYSFSKYTWLLIDITQDRFLIPFVFAFRFLMVGLLLAALILPLWRGGPARGEA